MLRVSTEAGAIRSQSEESDAAPPWAVAGRNRLLTGSLLAVGSAKKDCRSSNSLVMAVKAGASWLARTKVILLV